MARVWGWSKIDRNTFKFGQGMDAKIVRIGDGWLAKVEDNIWNGRFDYSRRHFKWVDANNDLNRVKKQIAREVRRILGRVN